MFILKFLIGKPIKNFKAYKEKTAIFNRFKFFGINLIFNTNIFTLRKCGIKLEVLLKRKLTSVSLVKNK